MVRMLLNPIYCIFIVSRFILQSMSESQAHGYEGEASNLIWLDTCKKNVLLSHKEGFVLHPHSTMRNTHWSNMYNKRPNANEIPRLWGSIEGDLVGVIEKVTVWKTLEGHEFTYKFVHSITLCTYHRNSYCWQPSINRI